MLICLVSLLTVGGSAGVTCESPATAGVPRLRSNQHPISITEASMFVTKTTARTRLQMFAEDLVLFQGLEPDSADRISADDLRRGLEDHKAFLLEKFVVRDAAGERLTGRVTDLKPFEIPADGIPSTEMMKHSAVYEIEHSFASPPEFLTIQQDIADENFIIPSEMSLHVHQSGTALNFAERLLPGASTTVRFDWEAPLSEDASDSEWELWFEKQREKTLGITSYSSVYSFVYLEPAEIRHELLIPLATLGTMIQLRHQDPSFVDVSEQDVIRKDVEKWLSGQNPVLINGRAVAPRFSRIDFYSLDLSDFAAQAEPRRVSMASGRVGVIMSYQPEDGIVRDASLTWNQFYSSMTKIPAVVIAGPERVERFEFSRFNKPAENTLTWACPEALLPQPVQPVLVQLPAPPVLKVPFAGVILLVAACCEFWLLRARPYGRISAGLFAALGLVLMVIPAAATEIAHPWRKPELPAGTAADVARTLHRGMYRALDFGTEDRVFDVLATSVDGPLLEQLYVQLMDSLRVREQGGAAARIRAVDYELAELQPRSTAAGEAPWPGFSCNVQWLVAGTVEHWGHVHERQNLFNGRLTVEPRNGEWKITRMDILGQEQKSARTTLRKFWQ
jgi:hypothetical protein